MRLENLTDLQLDALREVGNIGAGHAATALSQMTGTPIGVENPTIEMIPIDQVPQLLGGPEKLVAAAYSRVLGEIDAGMLFMADRESSLVLVDLMHGRAPGSTKSFGHEEEQIFTHVATILSAAYLGAIARMTDINTLPSAASFVLDMAGAILQVATIEAGMKAEHALLVRTSFNDEQTTADAMVFFMPDPDSLEVILGRLGVI